MVLTGADMFRVHQAAFLTLRGWECDPDGEWSKDGETQFVENVSGHPVRTTEFDLDDAYWREVD